MGSEKSSPAGDEITHLIQISMLLIKKKRRIQSSAFVSGSTEL